MNETAAIEPQVWVGPDRLLFCGVLPTLDWHRHSFHCVLLSPTRPFEVEAARGTTRCRAVLVPGGHRHRLRFDGQPMTTMYIPPHDDHFAPLVRPASAGVAPIPWSTAWSDALARWDATHDPDLLRRAIVASWSDPSNTVMDHRVRRMTRRFAHGEGLKESPALLAGACGLSTSRLAHLVKDHTGSSIGEVRRGYRFMHAARSMVETASFTRAAHAAQFADSAHFSRSFRAAYGIAPSRILFMSTRWTLRDDL